MKKILIMFIALFAISTLTVEAQYWGNRYNGGRSSHTNYYTNNYAGYPSYVSDQSYYGSGFQYTTYYNRDPVVYPYRGSSSSFSTYRGSPYANQRYSDGNYYRVPRSYSSYYSRGSRYYQSPPYAGSWGMMTNSISTMMPGLD